MTWKFRIFSMIVIVLSYWFVVRPAESNLMLRGISDLMVGVGIFLFGLALLIVSLDQNENGAVKG